MQLNGIRLFNLYCLIIGKVALRLEKSIFRLLNGLQFKTVNGLN